MKFCTYITFLGFMLAHAGAYALPLQGIQLKTDAEALAYCKATPNTYVAIIWPKGYSNLNYAIKELNQQNLISMDWLSTPKEW